MDEEWRVAPGAEVEVGKEGEQVSILIVEEEEEEGEEGSQECGAILKDSLMDTRAKKLNVGGGVMWINNVIFNSSKKET